MDDKNPPRPRKKAQPGAGKDQPGKRPRKKPKKPAPRKSLFGRLLRAVLIAGLSLAILGGAGLMLVYYYFTQDLPNLEALKNYAPKTVTFFYSDDGRVIGEYSHERRIVIPLAKIPPKVRQAFISAEDSNFYEHQGIDFVSIIRAFIKNMEAGRIVQGGSTITQQVTKSFLLSPEKTYTRKIREAILAFRIDKNLSKDEILFLYLNQIYLGHGAHGVESAAELYFDKHVDQLTLAEAAMLAGLTQAPSRYSPFSRPKAARRRQVYTIGRMLENGYITKEQADQALAEKLTFHNRPNVNLTETPYFTEEVRRILEEKFGEESLYNDGYKVYTTVNIEMQKAARHAIDLGLFEFAQRRPYRGALKNIPEEKRAEFLEEQEKKIAEHPLDVDSLAQALVTEVDDRKGRLKVRIGSLEAEISGKEGLPWSMLRGKKLSGIIKPGDVLPVRATGKNKDGGKLTFTLGQAPKVQSALFAMDNETGGVKVLIGGRDFNESQFNRAVQSRRQPGSSFKPIIYTAALENGFTPDSVLIDSPIVHDDFGSGRRWKPINYSGKFYGPTDLYTALTNSRNVIAIKLLNKIGVETAIEYARRMGIESPLKPYLPLALGASGVSLVEIVAAYTTFPNLGQRAAPMYITRIEDRHGRVIEENRPTHIRAIDPTTACTMISMLQGVVRHGTGTVVRALGRPCGGKTGTTNDLTDAWFIGFTPEYSAGVWVGLDDFKRMGSYESGGKAAAPIFLYFMREALKDKPVRDFNSPEGVTFVNRGSNRICYKEGTQGTGYSDVGGGGGDDFIKSEFTEKDL